MSASIFNGTAVKILKNILRFKDGTDLSSTVAGHLSTISSNVQTQLNNKIDDSEKGAVNGVATLDGAGKVPTSQLPSAIMEYKGTWNPATNTPTLQDGTGDAGDVYRVVASAAGPISGLGDPSMVSFSDGDSVLYNGSVWQKSDASDAVLSVNGLSGVVVLDTDDVAEGATNLYFTDTRAQTAITGAASTITTADLTANRAVVTDASGKIADSLVTDVELGYVSGVTSALQTQLDAKLGFTITATQTGFYSAGANQIIPVDSSGGGVTIQILPTIAVNSQIIIKDVTGSAETNTITINAVGGQLIDGSSSYQITSNYQCVHLLRRSGAWSIL